MNVLIWIETIIEYWFNYGPSSKIFFYSGNINTPFPNFLLQRKYKHNFLLLKTFFIITLVTSSVDDISHQGRSQTFSFGGTTGEASFATRGAANGLCRTFRKRPEKFGGGHCGGQAKFLGDSAPPGTPLAPPLSLTNCRSTFVIKRGKFCAIFNCSGM